MSDVVWTPNPQGHAQLLMTLGAGLNEYAREVASLVVNAAPPHTSRRRIPYRKTISWTVWVNGLVISGRRVKATGFTVRRKADSLQALVYTASSLGPMLELTGAKPHIIPIPTMAGARYGTRSMRRVRHPGFAARPHFGPAAIASLRISGRAMALGASSYNGGRG